MIYVLCIYLCLPVTSRCCRLGQRATNSDIAALVMFGLPCSWTCVSSGHRRARAVKPLSDIFVPSLRNSLCTWGHAPVLVRPHSRRNTHLTALSPHVFSPHSAIVLHRTGSHARFSHRWHTAAHAHRSALLRYENTLSTSSSRSRSKFEEPTTVRDCDRRCLVAVECSGRLLALQPPPPPVTNVWYPWSKHGELHRNVGLYVKLVSASSTVYGW